MRRMKIWTSMILATLMVLSMLPVVAAAETNPQAVTNVGLGDWYVPDWTTQITMADEGEYLAFTYDRSVVGWSCLAAPVTAEGIGAGSTFSFTMDFGVDRGYTSAFMVRLVYVDGSQSDIWPEIQEGKAEYTVTVPINATSTVTEVQIYPESPYDSFESKVVTVKLYGSSLIKNTDTSGMGDWYVPDWTTAITMTDEGEYLSFTYDRSQMSWTYFAAPVVAGVGAGGSFSFTMDFGAERGYTDSFMVRLVYADGSQSDVWPAIQEGKAVYNIEIPLDVTSTLSEVQIYPENPYSSFDSQVVTVKLYDAISKKYISNIGLGKWNLPSWNTAITMADEGEYLAFTYDRSVVGWNYFTAPALAEGIGAGSKFTFTMDFGADRGYTSAFMVRLVYADGSSSDLWPAIQEGKAEYIVTVPTDVTSTVTEVQIYPESPYDPFESQNVTVMLYAAKLAITPMVYEGLNPTYYPDWWGDNGSWATDNPITVSTENPSYMLLSYASRSASAAGWRCVIAEPSITVSAGATLTLDLEFEPERTSGNFLVRFFSDNGEGDVYVDITAKRATYTITVPDSVQGTISEIRIHPENPYAADLPDEASALRLYSMALSEKVDPNLVEAYNLILDDNIGVKFYLRLNDQFLQSSGASLQVTVDGASESLPIPEANEDGQYVFCVDIAAAQMTTPITLQLKNDDWTGEEWVYTAAGYAQEILAGEFDDTTKALVRAMLDYGGKAQIYFGYRTDDIANAGLTNLPEYTVPSAESNAQLVTGTLPGIQFYGASLLFRTRLAIRYYFTLQDGYEYQFTVDSMLYTAVKNENGLHYVEITDILPQNIDQVYTVTVVGDDGTEMSVSYSAMHYITRMYAKDTASDELKSLVKSIYAYGMAAKDYRYAMYLDEDLLKYSVEYTFHQATPNASSNPDWKYAPRLGNSDKPENWTAGGVWGTVYIQEGAEYVDNVAIELSNMKFWGYSPTKGWQLLSHDVPKGGFYDENFTNDDSVQFPEKMRIDEENLTNTILLDAETIGRNFHPFSAHLDFEELEMEDIQYVITTMDARLVLWDENGPDNRNQARYCFNVGGDWWAYPGATWNAQWTTNKEIAIGQYRPVRTQTTRVYMNTVPSELFDEMIPAELLELITTY